MHLLHAHKILHVPYASESSRVAKNVFSNDVFERDQQDPRVYKKEYIKLCWVLLLWYLVLKLYFLISKIVSFSLKIIASNSLSRTDNC